MALNQIPKSSMLLRFAITLLVPKLALMATSLLKNQSWRFHLSSELCKAYKVNELMTRLLSELTHVQSTTVFNHANAPSPMSDY